MTQDGDAASSDEPEHRCDRTRKDEQWDRYTQETGVQLTSRGRKGANGEILSPQLPYTPHPSNDQTYDEKQRQVRDERVYAEHNKNDGVVA